MILYILFAFYIHIQISQTQQLILIYIGKYKYKIQKQNQIEKPLHKKPMRKPHNADPRTSSYASKLHSYHNLTSSSNINQIDNHNHSQDDDYNSVNSCSQLQYKRHVWQQHHFSELYPEEPVIVMGSNYTYHVVEVILPEEDGCKCTSKSINRCRGKASGKYKNKGHDQSNNNVKVKIPSDANSQIYKYLLYKAIYFHQLNMFNSQQRRNQKYGDSGRICHKCGDITQQYNPLYKTALISCFQFSGGYKPWYQLSLGLHPNPNTPKLLTCITHPLKHRQNYNHNNNRRQKHKGSRPTHSIRPQVRLTDVYDFLAHIEEWRVEEGEGEWEWGRKFLGRGCRDGRYYHVWVIFRGSVVKQRNSCKSDNSKDIKNKMNESKPSIGQAPLLLPKHLQHPFLSHLHQTHSYTHPTRPSTLTSLIYTHTPYTLMSLLQAHTRPRLSIQHIYTYFMEVMLVLLYLEQNYMSVKVNGQGEVDQVGLARWVGIGYDGHVVLREDALAAGPDGFASIVGLLGIMTMLINSSEVGDYLQSKDERKELPQSILNKNKQNQTKQQNKQFSIQLQPQQKQPANPPNPTLPAKLYTKSKQIISHSIPSLSDSQPTPLPLPSTLPQINVNGVSVLEPRVRGLLEFYVYLFEIGGFGDGEGLDIGYGKPKMHRKYQLRYLLSHPYVKQVSIQQILQKKLPALPLPSNTPNLPPLTQPLPQSPVSQLICSSSVLSLNRIHQSKQKQKCRRQNRNGKQQREVEKDTRLMGKRSLGVVCPELEVQRYKDVGENEIGFDEFDLDQYEYRYERIHIDRIPANQLILEKYAAQAKTGQHRSNHSHSHYSQTRRYRHQQDMEQEYEYGYGQPDKARVRQREVRVVKNRPFRASNNKCANRAADRRA